jgi:serine-type D-Ala-D-Ala carboxypeptidase/endopeptidase (penicillin-binding protein 4)
MTAVVGSAVLSLSVGLLPTAAATADATVPLPLSVTDQQVRDNLELRSLAKRLGDDLTGSVVDAETGQEIWARDAAEQQIPASTVKIITAVNTLESFGPEHRFQTSAMTGATARRVVLVGGGDPSLSRRDLRRLAKQTAATFQSSGIRRIRVDVDDSLFPSPTHARGWKWAYTIRDVSPVRALVVNQHRSWDTSLDAGRVFARLLEDQGMRVRAVRRNARPEGATAIAQVYGDPVAQQVTSMLKTSDNDVAEGLHRLVAIQNGFPASWRGAMRAQSAVLARLGVAVEVGSVKDGSGLSRRDRLSPSQVTAVLRSAFDPAHPNLAVLQSGALAIAGVDGTLSSRYLRYVTSPTRCAAGLVEGKTGSLSGVIALSGLARGADGRVKVYSFLLNHVPAELKTRRAVDKLASTITGCW